jgi:hypothetical protein
VFCPVGRIFDVVVDMRPDSPTFKKWCGAWIDKDTHIVCPGFCAHGVFAAEEDSVICYFQAGTFFDKLDYPCSGLDPALGIEWPKPIDATDFVMSPKDLGSGKADEALWAKVKARIDDPIADIHTVTNSDIVVAGATVYDTLPILKKIQGTRCHLLQLNSSNRESFQAAVFSLRPQDGLIYLLKAGARSATTGVMTELLNVVQVCHEYRQPLVVVAEENFKEIELARFIIETEVAISVAVLIGQCLLYRGMKKADAAKRLNESQRLFGNVQSFTDFDALAGVAVDLLKQKKAGIYQFVNPGVLNLGKVKEFCSQNGVGFAENGTGKPGAASEVASGLADAAVAFDEIVATFTE